MKDQTCRSHDPVPSSQPPVTNVPQVADFFPKWAVRKRCRIFFCLSTAVFLLCAFLTTGCGSVSQPPKEVANAADLPTGVGEPECLLNLPQKISVIVERDRQVYRVPVEKGFPFFVEDRMHNVSGQIVEVVGVAHQATFALKSGAKVAFQRNSLVLELGTTQLQFRLMKGAYKVLIPGAILAIRGTRFQVTVDEDRSSEVRLYEGSIEITDSAGTNRMLAAGEKATFAPGGSSLTVTPLGNLPERFDQLPPEKVPETMR